MVQLDEHSWGLGIYEVCIGIYITSNISVVAKCFPEYVGWFLSPGVPAITITITTTFAESATYIVARPWFRSQCRDTEAGKVLWYLSVALFVRHSSVTSAKIAQMSLGILAQPDICIITAVKYFYHLVCGRRTLQSTRNRSLLLSAV